MIAKNSNTEHPYIHCAATKELPPAPPLDSLIENGITKIIVLDFDGVLNPLSAGTLDKKHFPTDHAAVVRNPHHANNPTEEPPSYIVKWSTKLVGELNGILSDSDGRGGVVDNLEATHKHPHRHDGASPEYCAVLP